MKLDVTCFRYLTKEDFRVMEAIEQGMRNHELVPIELIGSLAKLRHGGIHRFLSNILRYKLVAHANSEYNGYRLSYLGYDVLALHALMLRGVISSVGPQIGIGKESDIFEAQDENGNEIVLKIHRLGRTSFRSVRRNRDYMVGKRKASWLYMSRLAATKEFAFMKALYEHGFPTPVPIDQNRHVVAMSRIHGFPLAQIKAGRMEGADKVFKTCVNILHRLARHGLVHCDFNEFNLMVDEEAHVTLIDFPQMVSITHINASELFQRDLQGLAKFFAMKMHYEPPDEYMMSLEEIVGREAMSLGIDSGIDRSAALPSEDSSALETYYVEARDSEEAEDDNLEGDLEMGGPYEEPNGLGDDESRSEKDVGVDDAVDNGVDSDDDDDDDDGQDVPENTAELGQNLQSQVVERARRAALLKLRKNSSASRNMTKKRNKYGKIDRNFRNFDGSG